MTEKVKKILDVIPYDRWVSAAEIAAETGISSSSVGALIGRDLLIVYVECRSMRSSERGAHFYRRIHTA